MSGDYIGAVEQNGGEYFDLMLDGGAMAHVCKPNFGTDFGILPSTRVLRDVQSKKLKHYGLRHVRMELEGGQTCAIKFEIADVFRNILSMSLLMNSGVKFYYEVGDSWMEKNGVRIPIYFRDGIYIVRIKMLKRGGGFDTIIAPLAGELEDEEELPDQGIDEMYREFYEEELGPADPDALNEPSADRENIDVLEGDFALQPVPQDGNRPTHPSSYEQKVHELTHIPHADWCSHCIAGRGRADAHRSGNVEERTNGVIQFDYCFASPEMTQVEDEAQSRVTILVAKDMDSGYPFATVVRRKGGLDSYAVEVMARWIDQLGLTDAYFQSDGEAAIKDLVRAVAKKCSMSRIRFRAAPKGSPSSNGGAEGTVKLIMSIVRVFISALHEQCGVLEHPGHPLLVWMVRHAFEPLEHTSRAPTSEYMAGTMSTQRA